MENYEIGKKSKSKKIDSINYECEKHSGKVYKMKKPNKIKKSFTTYQQH